MNLPNKLLDTIIERIKRENPLHYKNIAGMLLRQNADYFERAENFLVRYSRFLEKDNKDIGFALNCYFRMLADITVESTEFLRSGKYTSSSFAEVRKRVYDSPEIMEYYMHGLLLSQFLWDQHYRIYSFFIDNLPLFASVIKNYLEVGSGHGLYISEAIKLLGKDTCFDVVDISTKSLDITRNLVASAEVNYRLCDIFEIDDPARYDFITLGEVLEHVEEPQKLLAKVSGLLKPGGRAFITVPANAPAIDHIYLFHNANEIRQMIAAAGFSIMREFTVFEKEMPPEKAEKMKLSMMYAGFIKK